MRKFTRISIVSLVASLALYFSAHSLAAGNEPFDAAELVPAGIDNIQTGGSWSDGKDEGFFRTVIVAGGIEHVAHQIFIQWLRNVPETQGYALVRTVGIKEINSTIGNVLRVGTSFGEINAFEINVTAHNRGGEKTHFVITVAADGNYKIRY